MVEKIEEQQEIQEQQVQGYLLLFNISKKRNMGQIIRSAAAFNITKVFTIIRNIESKSVKMKKFYQHFGGFGNKGTLKYVEFHNFQKIKEAKQYFVDNNITVCGIEINKQAQSVVTQPFRGNTVFFLGNEGTGLDDSHKQLCDQFVYIPQYSNRTASLNVNAAAAIVFHHFAIWAHFKEAEIFGEKFKNIAQNNKENQQKQQENSQSESNESMEEQKNSKEIEELNFLNKIEVPDQKIQIDNINNQFSEIKQAEKNQQNQDQSEQIILQQISDQNI